MRAHFRITEDVPHAPWNPGDILTIQIEALEGDGYTAQTVETYPADLRQQHEQELTGIRLQHARELARLRGEEEPESLPPPLNG